MDITIGILIGIVVLVIAFLLFEYRIRKPDVLLLYESKGQIDLRKGLFYPRHFSLPLSRTTHPVRLTVEATAVGNLEVRIKLIGSVAPSLKHIHSLIRIGGWNPDATSNAAEEVQLMLQGLIKEYVEGREINTLSSTGIVNNLNESSELIQEKFGVELISLTVQSLEPTDPEISEALRQQEQARLMEQTERLNNQARSAAARAKLKADEEILQMEHDLELKKAESKKTILSQESLLTQQTLEDELKRSRMRLAFEKEELELLKSNPELLILTPQAARLAEASQNLKNARTIVSLTPKELAQGSDLLTVFQNLIRKALEDDKGKDVT
ncbi:MAG: hypothetical protein GWN61_05255 [candidate division Zixibacteria bacterium]|nr:hypothetical protein [candidate division Zixibacteria bacterium]NIW44884.1 hypothetical protein [Gammaproteobacteria bacterium]NIR65422.1 hypothetical protein [candidate division Zixibacteria bacterium]NIS47111.1 hypothetical protein [candidate division Zixibacteria bacterium]NIU15252.1 hypothetical protein [candidate division Zixibacteria bacterium]